MTATNKRSIDVRPEHDPLFPRLLRYGRYGISYLYYLNRPAVWPAIYRKIRDKIAGNIPGPQDLKAMATAGSDWCAPRTLSTKDGLAKLGITNFINVREKYADVFRSAQDRAGAIPVWMGGGSNLDLLYTVCTHLKPETIVETGVANGWSSLSFLLYLNEAKQETKQETKPGTLCSVDLPLLELHNDEYVGVAVPLNLRGPWNLFRMADREGLPKIIAQHPVLDLVYYDSDKSEQGRLFAYNLLWAHLRPGGILISDDISDNLAFARFCANISIEPIVVAEPGCNPQGILVKPE